ncbi:MAG: terminase large subunit domain-containing protein [Actinomycetota bacterium]
MPSRKPGPKTSEVIPIDISGLSNEYPQRAFDLVGLFGYVPYKWQRSELAALTCVAERPPLAYIQVAKKNGKTALAAMVTLCELILNEDRHVYAVSDSEKNLASVFWLELTEAIRRSGYEDSFTTYQRQVEYTPTRSFLQMRPGNFAASQGINPHLVIADEVHLMDREVWNGYGMSTDARDDALVMGITTPGYNLDCAARDLYLEAKAGTDPDLYATIYEPRDIECAKTDETAWREANPAFEESPALRKALARHARRMRENDFRRFRLGQWTATEKAWFDAGVFDALAVEGPIRDGSRAWLALDGSWSGDTTAVVACDELFRLQVLGHWAPPIMNDGKWRVPMADVEQCIRDACARLDVEEIAFDPARWSRNMQALEDEGLPVVEFPQTPQRMIPATTRFYDAVVDGGLSWTNDDKGKALAAHVQAAEVREGDNGAMIKKPTFAPAAHNIDCAVAAVMAHFLATAGVDRADLDVEWINIHSDE